MRVAHLASEVRIAIQYSIVPPEEVRRGSGEGPEDTVFFNTVPQQKQYSVANMVMTVNCLLGVQMNAQGASCTGVTPPEAV